MCSDEILRDLGMVSREDSVANILVYTVELGLGNSFLCSPGVFPYPSSTVHAFRA
jgi:hypothetical protein